MRRRDRSTLGRIGRWWTMPRARLFNDGRIALLSVAAATLFYYSPVWLWFLTSSFAIFYTLKNLRRSQGVKAWKEGDSKAVPLEKFWAAERLEQEAIIGVAVVASFFAGCWALYLLLTVPTLSPQGTTFLRLILPLVLTIVNTSLATYSWKVHRSYHAAIQFIQTDKLLKQSLEKRLEEVTKRLEENGHGA